MRIAVIIPDRGDRPQFLNQCLKMMDAQTLKPATIILQNYKAESDKPDITQRYRRGYERVSELNINHPGCEYDLIFFVENDDYYTKYYIEDMVTQWKLAGKPDLFGTGYTIYYHIGLRKYFTFNHPTRASMMSTCIKPNLEINWPVDNESFTDMHLWTQEKCFKGSKKVWAPNTHLSIGIKHGVGLCGGRQHSTGLHRYTINGGQGNESAGGRDDAELKWLYQNVKEESIFNFYKSFGE